MPRGMPSRNAFSMPTLHFPLLAMPMGGRPLRGGSSRRSTMHLDSWTKDGHTLVRDGSASTQVERLQRRERGQGAHTLVRDDTASIQVESECRARTPSSLMALHQLKLSVCSDTSECRARTPSSVMALHLFKLSIILVLHTSDTRALMPRPSILGG